MDLRYELYLSPRYKFYRPANRTKEQKAFFSKPNVPTDWKYHLDETQHWMYCGRKNIPLPVQGWKIHLSTTMDNAQKILDIVTPILVERNTPFKYVSCKWELFLKNSKYGDRSGSGKFITIYPVNEQVFISLLKTLDKALSGIEKGPYILSDNRWGNGNLYYRYGGFAEMFTDNGDLAIVDSQGNYVSDIREPRYYVPDFVEVPSEIKENELKREKEEVDLETRLDKYSITEPIHFSNGGGVYKAIRKKDGMEVIIKEGRPGVGLDGAGKDGFYRINVEADVLKRLSSVDGVVNIHENFQAWEHNFLVEDYLKGVPLNTWLAINYPFHSERLDDYSSKALEIVKKLRKIINDVHATGFGMGDVTPNNIMITEENLDPVLIDLESADLVDATNNLALRTQGFSSHLSKTRRNADWFGFLRVVRHLFCPIEPVQDIDIRVEEKIDSWISEKFDSSVINEIKSIEQDVFQSFRSYKDFKRRNKGTENNVAFAADKVSQIKVMLIEGLREGITENLSYNKKTIIPGDIRQYELNGGHLNTLTGSFGIILGLSRTGQIDSRMFDWIDKYSNKRYWKGLEDGLFDGKAGIACTLYDLDYKERSLEIIDSIKIDNVNESDITLLSGFSGIGLAFLSIYLEEKSNNLLMKSKECADYIIDAFYTGNSIPLKDPDFIPMGLLDGWSGAALFLTLLHKITNENKWLEYAKKMMDLELSKCELEEGVLLTDDDGRLLPYLSGGTAGMSIPLFLLSEYDEKYLNSLEQIRGLIPSKCSYSAGLFRGFTSFLFLSNVFQHFGRTVTKDETVDLLKTIHMYLISDGDKLLCPGDYGYKLSGDIFSGSAGVLLALQDSLDKSFYSWIPLTRSSMKIFFNKEGAVGEALNSVSNLKNVVS